ncbi:unnamed protein product [Urochloa humidicola]
MEAGGGETERSSFWCLQLSRYVVAVVMTVLVVTITFNTVKLVLYERSHDPVRLSAVRGAVVYDTPRAAILFYHAVRVSSARGFMYYATGGTTACLSAASGGGTDIACFRTNRTIRAVEQRGQSYFLMEAEGTRHTMNSSYFDALYNVNGNGTGGSSSLRSVTLRLESAFVAERRSGRNTTTEWNIYYCELTITPLYSDDEDELQLLDYRYDEPCQPRN